MASLNGRIANQVRFIFDAAGQILGYKNPQTDADEEWSGGGSGSSDYLGSFTLANLPSAAANQYKTAFCTNYGAAGNMLIATGTRWRPLNGRAVLYTFDGPAVTISGTSEQLARQYAIPANLLQPGDRLELCSSFTKSGNTQAATVLFTFGTSATGLTPANTAMVLANTSPGYMSTTSQSLGFDFDYRVESLTSMYKLGSASITQPYQVSNSTALPAITVDLTVLNYLSVLLTGGASENISLTDFSIQLFAGTN